MKSIEIFLIVIWAINIGVELTRHGETKVREYNFFLDGLLPVAVSFILFKWAGLFGGF